MTSARIQAYWWQAANFGDCLTEAICAHYGLPVEHAHPHFSQLIGVGSILERVPTNYTGYVLGAGFLHEHSRCSLSQARVLALRGPLTWERSDRPKLCVLGDPGLLARQLVGQQPEPQFKLGVVLHYADRQLATWQQFAAENPTEVRWIDVRQPPLQVIREIALCAGIVSSSLHGLIVADALQIPSAWKWSDDILGHGFKFFDHTAAVQAKRKPLAFAGNLRLANIASQLSAPPQRAVAVANELHQMLTELPQLLQRDPRHPRLPWLRYSVAKVQRLLRHSAA